ncbi:ABC transporter ATP-binding protein [Acuticoccus sediminis]|uniref:ABC transporter ATP-binding protein n=1 Tax=Acuticoccus sediminis TaxID=2184697 RepID=UPI00192E5051|nr:ABC transporter ATP-binding protein [Acuticoccus sediminis]
MSLAATTAEGAPGALRFGRAPAAPAAGEAVLRIDRLAVRRGPLTLVDDVTLDVAAGETVCLVGESGCGKSLTLMAALGLLTPPLHAEGSVRIAGHQMVGTPESALGPVRGRDAAMIFQNPMSALNPIRTVGRQIEEALRLHTALSPGERRHEVTTLLEHVGITDPARCARSYPNQLSGGMCQRVMIAMAIASRPRVLLADEPTTALDVTIQAQILDLLKALQGETGMALVFVTHDLGVVAEIADRVAVMYAGRIVETAPADELFTRPHHPYTRALMECRIGPETPRGTALEAIGGSVPPPAARPPGCYFSTRCPKAAPVCATRPAMVETAPGSAAACHFARRPQ